MVSRGGVSWDGAGGAIARCGRHRQPSERDCQICGAGMCDRWCDYGSWVHFGELSTSKLHGGGLEWARHMYDMTFSAQYRVWQQEEWLPSDDAGVGYALVGTPGLVMPLQKLGAVLRGRHGALVHVCEDCMLAVTADAAELIAAGQICEAPFCERKPESACHCCGGSFCRACLTVGGFAVPEVSCDHGPWPVIYGQASGRLEEADVPYSAEERYPAAGLCISCGCERIHALKKEGRRILAQDYAARLARLQGPGGQTVLAVPAASRLTAGGRRHETGKSQEVARGYAAEIARRAAEAVAARPCRRSKSPGSGVRCAPHTEYVPIPGKPRASSSRLRLGYADNSWRDFPSLRQPGGARRDGVRRQRP